MQVWSQDSIVGSATLPSGYAYATIGPGSQEDLVRVEGRLLRVGTVVPLNGAAGVTMVRPGATNPVELHLWKDCEHPIAGPRAPFIAPTVVTAYAAGADATYTRQMVVPFSGRRSARFSLSWSQASGVANFDYVLQGTVRSPANGSGGGNATPTTELDGRTLLVTGAQIVDGTKPNAYEFYIGGYDEEEAFDFLTLYTAKPLAGTVLALTIDCEVWGDRGLG